jgi:hypothetical protein
LKGKKTKMQKFFPNSLVMLLAKVSSPTALIPQLLAKAGAVKNKKRLCQQPQL